jgi:hypothetical protein
LAEYSIVLRLSAPIAFDAAAMTALASCAEVVAVMMMPSTSAAADRFNMSGSLLGRLKAAPTNIPNVAAAFRRT